MTLNEWAAKINAIAGENIARVEIINGEIVLTLCMNGIEFRITYTDKTPTHDYEAVVEVTA